jgi:hypothetical protein
VFISHASEDKEAVVRPLAHALRDGGLVVWYDEFELRMGDSLRRKIDLGLAKSRFGVVVLSRSFLGKGWPNYELDGLVTRSVSGEQVLLPIWHEITTQEVVNAPPWPTSLPGAPPRIPSTRSRPRSSNWCVNPEMSDIWSSPLLSSRKAASRA